MSNEKLLNTSSSTSNLPEISVIGVGALGHTLVKALLRNDCCVKSVFNRSPRKAEHAADEHNITHAGEFPTSKDQLGKLVFITVGDQAISTVAQRLATLSNDWSEYTIVHCSGNFSADTLKPLKKQGAATASFHPLQTFGPQSSTTDFNNIFISLQGDDRTFPLLKDIANQFGANILTVDSRQKSDLHTAAVMASNYLVTLIDAATETASQNGLPKDIVQQALRPLIEQSAANAGQHSFEEALSGPIRRGDTETVGQHLDLIKDTDLLGVYCHMGKRTVARAKQTDLISTEKAQKLLNLFAEYG